MVPSRKDNEQMEDVASIHSFVLISPSGRCWFVTLIIEMYRLVSKKMLHDSDEASISGVMLKPLNPICNGL